MSRPFAHAMLSCAALDWHSGTRPLDPVSNLWLKSCEFLIRPFSMRAVFVILAVPLATGVLVEDLALGEARAAAVERRALPLQAKLRATVQALPKTGAGCLGPAAARYALHRVFVQKGWFVHGLQDLDPVGNASEGSMSPVAMLQDQVPEAQAVFENHLQRGGLCLRDLALLAGLLEDLVHRETMQRVSAAFKAKKVPLVGRVTVEHLASMLDYVMMSYILEVANLEGTGLDVAENVSVYLEGKRPMEEVYPAWPRRHSKSGSFGSSLLSSDLFSPTLWQQDFFTHCTM
ncbi:unnamed protein product [Effrenium voratum]|nr:unnamed protein product [Effrenium voratum]